MMFKRSELPEVVCTTDTAAEIIGVARSRIRQLVAAGRLTPYPRGSRPCPRAMLLDGAEVKAYARERQTSGRPRGGALLD